MTVPLRRYISAFPLCTVTDSSCIVLEAAPTAAFASLTCLVVQAKTKEASALADVVKEKDAMLAQKQRQIDGLVEGLERRPDADTSTGARGENVALARLKERMAADMDKLKAAQKDINDKMKQVGRASRVEWPPRHDCACVIAWPVTAPLKANRQPMIACQS